MYRLVQSPTISYTTTYSLIKFKCFVLIHLTYNSTSSTAILEYCLGSYTHILSSMSSVVGVLSVLTKYEGLRREQHVLLE